MITFDAKSASTVKSATNQITFTHVVGGGANLFVLASAIHTGGAGRNIANANIGGTALTQAIDQAGDTEIWYCVNPPVGSKTVTVNYGANFDRGACGGVSFKGADIEDPLGDTSVGDTTGLPDVTITAVTGGVLVDALDIDSDAALSPSAGQTEIHDVDLVGTSERSASSYKLTPAPGATNMGWELNANHVYVGAAFKPQAEGGSLLLDLL